MKNGHIESFNGRLRDECLNVVQFLSLDDARPKVEACRVDYNQRRPHSSLGHLTPSEFVRNRQEQRSRKSAELQVETVYEWDQRQSSASADISLWIRRPALNLRRLPAWRGLSGERHIMNNEPASYSAPFVVTADHPALSGHFPGSPVVPGVLILDEVIRTFEAETHRAVRVRGLRHAKFLAPLFPGEVVRITTEAGVDWLSFGVYRDGLLIAKGTYELEDCNAS